VAQHRPREGLGDEEQQEPADPLPDDAEDGVLEVRLVEGTGLDRGHAQDVFGLLLDHDVHDIVHGDEADHAAGPLEDRDRQQVVLGHLVGDRFLILEHLHRDRMMAHDVGDRLVQLRHHEVPERDRAEQPSRLRLHDVAGVDGLLLARHGADVPERLPDGHPGVQADELRGHDAARRMVRVAEELLDLGPDRGTQLREETSPGVLSHLPCDVRALVRRELLQNPGRALHVRRLNLREKASPTLERRLVEQLGCPGEPRATMTAAASARRSRFSISTASTAGAWARRAARSAGASSSSSWSRRKSSFGTGIRSPPLRASVGAARARAPAA
jgi:hypothetical protein